MSFKQPVDFKELGPAAVPIIKQQNPSVFACIARRKNGNVVVFELNGDKIDTYWLDLEPDYKEAARKRGREHDRDEFGRGDHYYYGYKVVHSSPKCVKIQMKKVPKKDIYVNPQTKKALIQIEKELCVLDYIYVADNSLKGITYSVSYVEVFGRSVKDNTEKSEVVYGKK